MGGTIMRAAAEARARELVEPLKRRFRTRGRDPLLAGRRDRARERGFPSPIDVVVTWVDDSDPAWRAERDRYLRRSGSAHETRDAASDARFHSLDELRYALRGVDQHAPWVNDVVLVTSGQCLPSWLDPTSVRVVTHQEILPAAALPTFNSHAIESAVWRIPGLTEHFVYLNDDVLIRRSVGPNDFFTPTGNPRVCLTSKPVPAGPPRPGESAAVSGARNARDLLRRAGLGDAARLIAHTPIPQRRSIHAELHERFPAALDRTATSRFRSLGDVAPVFLHTWFALLSGSAQIIEKTHRYVELSRADGPNRLAVEALRRDVDYLCPNLAANPVVSWAELADCVHACLEQADPIPSRFELE